MVNQYTKRPPVTVPAHMMGISCGECGLPGLGVRQVPVREQPGSMVPMLICGFCHVGLPIGCVRQAA